MKLKRFLIPALLLAGAFASAPSAHGQDFDWLEGKWLATDEAYIIHGSSIRVVTRSGFPYMEGTLSVNSHSELLVDGSPIGVTANADKKTLTLSGQSLRKYDNLSLPSSFSSILGRWTANWYGDWKDGQILTVEEKDLNVEEDGETLHHGVYYIDDSGYIIAFWDEPYPEAPPMRVANGKVANPRGDYYLKTDDAWATEVIASVQRGEMEAEDVMEDIPFQLVEEKPSFNGGDANEFSTWVNSRLVYPEVAKNNGVQGRVTLQFTVTYDGRVINVKVIRGVDASLDKEAVRVVSSSPRWKPGRQRGKAVNVTYTFPVIFQLR